MLRDQALLAWLQKVIDKSNIKQQDLLDPAIYFQLAEQLPGMSSLAITEQSSSSVQWQNRYTNFKIVYQALQNYYRDQLNSSFPSGLPSINLLLMSKGSDKQSLMVLLEIFFIACIQCSSKQKFVAQIMTLQQGQMTELMRLIQQSSNSKEETEKYEEVGMQQQKQKMDELYFKIQSLYSENDALRNQFVMEIEQKSKLQSQITKLEEENRKIKRELDEKIIYLQQKEQQEMEEQSTNKVISESNEEIITILKKQLLDQQHKYLGMVSKLKEQIYDLQEQLDSARDKIADLQSETMVNIKVKHENCVNTNEHKAITNKLQLKIKSKEQKQNELERELVRMKFEIEEKERKFQKQSSETKKVKQQLQEVKSQGPMVNKKTAQELKLYVLTGIRDNLKQKLNKPS